MYYCRWFQGNLIELINNETDLKPPRPVFYEEMDLLGFDEYFDYERTDDPVLWSIGRKYFYDGKHIATAMGGNALSLPDLKVYGKHQTLKKIDVDRLIEINKDKIIHFVNFSLNMIRETLHNYQDNYPVVSFSGGKDSQILLDLVKSISDDILVIFSDTSLEHNFTYENIINTEKYYGEKFLKGKPVKEAIELFDLFGLPSRFKRWCTPILKTSPYYHVLFDLLEDKHNVLVFEGVRRDESKKRKEYDSIAENVIYNGIVNARPILDWNITEVFLYILLKKLPLNRLYKYGLLRVGCEICPYQSKWSETILSHINNTFDNKYRKFIDKYSEMRGLSEDKYDENVIEGFWKMRCGCKGMEDVPFVFFNQTRNSLKSYCYDPCSSFEEWSKVLSEEFVSYVIEREREKFSFPILMSRQGQS